MNDRYLREPDDGRLTSPGYLRRARLRTLRSVGRVSPRGRPVQCCARRRHHGLLRQGTNSVRAAADIQRRFAAYNTDASETLSVRIGIDAGEPVEDHNDLFGSTVQLASRLCSEAEANGIIVSGFARDLCQEEDAARFMALGERRFKGFADKAQVFRFEWRD